MKEWIHGISYTMEHAHDQVQAIRMLRFETEDEDEFRHYVEKYHTYNDACAHLQSLLRVRLERARVKSQ